MGIGVFEVIGAMLVAYVMGAVMKDWLYQKSLIVRAYLTELRSLITESNPWYIQHQADLRQIATLDQTIRAMDDARDSLHKAMTDELIPKIKSQEIVVNTLRWQLDGKTKELNETKVQLSDAYAKLEHFIAEHKILVGENDGFRGENRILQAKVMSLEGDVHYLRGRVTLLAKLFVPNAPAFMPTKLKTFNFKLPLKRRKK